MYVQNKHKGNKTKIKSMKPKLLKTLNMNQFYISRLIASIGTYNKKNRIWKMGENSSPWTKFDTLTTKIFWIYFSSSDIIKFVAYHHKFQHQCGLRSKIYMKCKKKFNFTSKIWTLLQNMSSWCCTPLI